MITIQVVNHEEAPIISADVQISWRGRAYSTGRTNDSGNVSWSVSGGGGTIYVNGWEVYDGEIDDNVTVQFSDNTI
ncbi:MAG: hypothetical protein LC099_10805 [Anaerolineales bacterium]|nr:hypothetical protein [Anaerolineales bacterium]